MLKKGFWLISIFCLGISFFSTPLFAQEQDTDSTSATSATAPTFQTREIQRLLDDWRIRSAIPGATLSVYLPQHDMPLTFASGTTIYGGSTKVSDDTLFQAGSITKSFTSMIILQLEAEGKLNIDDSITKYLPQYPQWQDVTIRELLNHTSGIFNYTETDTFNNIRKDDPEAEFTPEEIVRLAADHPPYFAPGHGWKYSNTNYVLAGMIIQAVTDEPVSDVMNHYLHNGIRLNLLNTYYWPGLYSNSFMSHMAHGYNTSGMDVTGDNMSWAYTAGAIVTTTQDLLTWWRALFQGHLLPDQQMEEMTTLVCEHTTPQCRAGETIEHFSGDEAGKGYGLGVIQTAYGSSRIGPVWWHNGSTAGYKAIVMWFPQSNIYMALTINRDPGYLLEPDNLIIREVLEVLLPNAEWHVQHAAAPAHHWHKKKKTKSKKHHHTQTSSAT